jgi:poly(3-hydroxybutyrate) depolymerase
MKFPIDLRPWSTKISTLLLPLFFMAMTFNGFSQERAEIVDKTHFSEVFGEVRNFRVFLPSGHAEKGGAAFPVVYFFHGWSQRYFGSLKREQSDPTTLTVDDSLAFMAEKHQILVVKADGYNREYQADYYLRPYNVSPVETHRQFPMYFPELVGYVDRHFKTQAKRESRAVAGFSMGGFMSLLLAAKFSDMLVASVPFCPSPEFFVGPKNFPTEYYHGHMARNFEAVKVRYLSGDEDFIRAYHKDLDEIWSRQMTHYETAIYETDHAVVGLREMFHFLTNTFENPPEKPEKWNHIDVYPNFRIWDYQIYSDRDIPGFTVLQNVSKAGFRSSVKSKLPEGESLPFVNLSIQTPGIYEKKSWYKIHQFNLENGERMTKDIQADNLGRLFFELDGFEREVYIESQDQAKPELVLVDHQFENEDWPVALKKLNLAITLLNKGGMGAMGINAKITPSNERVKIWENNLEIGDLNCGETYSTKGAFVIEFLDKSSIMEQITIEFTDGDGSQWRSNLNIHIMGDEILEKAWTISDGRELTYAVNGTDTVTSKLGTGNGDGIANSGESIVVLAKDKGIWRPVHLSSKSTGIDLKSDHTRISDNWTSFDHVGGSFKYSQPLVLVPESDEETIPFFAHYWLPDYPDHFRVEGKINVAIVGNDQTGPGLSWIKTERNLVRARLYDAGKIVEAKAKLTAIDDPTVEIELSLNDQGKLVDRVEGDLVFTGRVEVPVFGQYKITLFLEDEWGNKNQVPIKEPAIFHGTQRYHQ